MISIKSRRYYDHLGRLITGGMPIGNQGDEGTYVTEFSMYAGVVLDNSITVELVAGNPAKFIISGLENGWNDTGITAGDTIVFTLESFDGETTFSGYMTASIVDGDTMTVGSYPVSLTGNVGRFFINKTMQAVDVAFNLVPQDVSSSEQSFIDNTTVRLRNENIASLGIGSTVALTQIGEFSGGIIREATIKRNANSSMTGGIIVFNYEISIKFVWWGYLSLWKSGYFQDILTVTPLVRVSFLPVFNDFGNRLNYIFKPATDGNSGFRDENFNQNPSPFTVQSCVWKDDLGNVMGAFDYSKNSSFEIELSSNAGFGTNFGLIFFNDIQDQDVFSSTADNDLGQFSHDRLTLFGQVATLTATTGQSFISALGKNGEQYEVNDIEISITGSVATIKGRIEPNQAFKDKFLDENNVNKRFALLVRSETSSTPATNYSKTVNSTAWVGDGEVAPIVLGAYPMSLIAYDHANDVIGGKDDLIIEDDVRLNLKLKFDRNRLYKSVSFSPIAYNTVTGEWFRLEDYTFVFDNTILPDGTQNIATTQPAYYAGLFPQTAPTIRFEIQRDITQDTPTEYGVEMDIVSLIRWENWLVQQGVNIDFYNNANKNWLTYQTGDWVVGGLFELEVEEGVYQNLQPISIEDYDHNPDLDWTIEFEREDGTPITTPLIGEIVKVRAICTEVNGNEMEDGWGMITVEPYESQPRYVISSIYPQGVQPSNPLIPTITSGDLLEITGWGTDTLVFECMFDPNRINTINGVSFSFRVKTNRGENRPSERHKVKFPLVQLPYKPDTQGKDGNCCDCEPELKLASIESNELIKNDITGVYHKLTQPELGETVEYRIYKDGLLLPNYGVEIASFPKDPNVSAFIYNWRDYLIAYGAGCYEIKKFINPAGIDMEVSWGKYRLLPFTTENAEGTTRILYQANLVSQFEENGVLECINFTDSRFEDSYRFKGMFSQWKPNNSVTNHYSSLRKQRTANIISKEKYNLEMIDAGFCEVMRLYKISIQGSILRMSDHNWSNPDQRMIIIDCVQDEDNTFDPTQYAGSRVMSVNMQLAKMNENSVSRFGGTNQIPLGITSVLQTIGASQTPTPSVCLPATFTAKNTQGTTVASQSVASGSTATVTVPDGTVTIKDHLGNIIGTVTTPSGGNSDYITSLGGSTTVVVKNSANETLDSVTLYPGGSDTSVVGDNVITLRNTDGDLLSTNSFPASQNGNIVAPDATVNFETVDGTPAGSQNVPSGEATTVVIPNAPTDDWVRPSSWRPIPAIGETESVVYILFAIFPNGLNQLALNVSAISSVFAIDVIDDTGVTSTITSGFNNLTFDYNSITSSVFRGYKQVWLKIYPTNPTGSINALRTDLPHSTYGGGLSTGVLEVITNNMSSGPIVLGWGSSTQKNTMLEHIDIRHGLNGFDIATLCCNLISLRKLEIPAGVYAVTNMSNSFNNTSLQKIPNGVIFISSFAFVTAFSLSNIEEARHDFSVTPSTVTNNIFQNYAGRKIHGYNMGLFTTALSFTGCQTVKEVLLDGYMIGHNLTQVGMFGADVFTNWVDSLGTASGSQTITVSLAQFNSFGGVGSYVATELTNKGYTLVY